MERVFCTAICTNSSCSLNKLHAPVGHKTYRDLREWDQCLAGGNYEPVNRNELLLQPIEKLADLAQPGIGKSYSSAEGFNLVMFEVMSRLEELKTKEVSLEDRPKFERIMTHLGLRLDNLPWHN